MDICEMQKKVNLIISKTKYTMCNQIGRPEYQILVELSNLQIRLVLS